MKLQLKLVDDAEIVHFASSHTLITSSKNRIRVVEHGATRTFSLPAAAWERPLLPFRLARRALRLDKCNVAAVFEAGRLSALVAIRQGCVYHVEVSSGKITTTLKLRQCRNVLHQSICTSAAGYLYFGEYGGNAERTGVPIYRSRDAGRSWEVIHEFPAKSIKHVHGCYWDPHANRIWVCTGDFANENVILSADENFTSIERYGDGSQSWRTCYPLFFPDSVVWAMDSQLETSYLCRMDRATHALERLQAFPGPVWYAKELTDGWFVLATANEIGPGVKDDCTHVLASRDALHWETVLRIPHDRWPKRYFKFGVIGFADGPQSSQDFYLFSEALTGMDGRAYRSAIVENG